jgi:ribose transport system ATP-binding protein
VGGPVGSDSEASVSAAAILAMPAMAPRLEMRGVKKRFGATQALGGVDLTVLPGEVHALLGQNGAGKSTLVKILSGAYTPDEGELRLDGQAYRPASPLEGRRAGVAMIYQELSLAPHLTVAENILLGVEPSKAGGLIDWAELRARARAALAELHHPEISPDARVGALSIAAQQVVEIGRAIALGARVLVLDEPTSSLTQADAEALFALIDRLRSQGQAIIYITHFIEEAKRVASRFTVLRDGQTVGGGETAGTEVRQIVDLMVGRRMEQLYPRSPRKRGEPILEVSGLAGRDKPVEATFTLHRGEVLGLAGLVGAGRTELLRLIAGLDPARVGSVKMRGAVPGADVRARWADGVALVSENRKEEGLALGLSIADNLTLSKMPFVVKPSERVPLVSRWIDRLRIRCQGGDQRIGDLSGGNQQKVAIARLLHHGVDVLLLDEPTRGIDVGSKAQIYELIDELCTREDKAVIMVSSYLPELLGVCDRIAVMCRGRLGPAHDVAGLTEQDLVRAAAAA